MSRNDARSNSEHTSIRHSLHCIHREIQKYLFYLAHIYPQCRNGFIVTSDLYMCLRTLCLHHMQHLFTDLTYGTLATMKLARACKEQKITYNDIKSLHLF